jgi:bla regulator protein BlaR1
MLIVPESSISVLNLLPQNETENTMSESLSAIPANIEIRQTSSKHSMETIIQVNNTISTSEHINLPNNNTTHYKKKFIIINIISIIWITGLLIILIGTIILQIYFTHKLKLCKRIDDSDLLIIIDKCKRTLGIKRNINIYIGDSFKSPFIIGLLKPRIYISEQLINMDQAHFEHVILHELAHYKRKDILYNIFSILAISIHWFNPIIWKVTSIIKADIDLACDTYILNKLGEDKAKSYGNSILVVTRLFISQRNQIRLACYFSNKKQLERRIIMINKFKNNTYKFTAIYLVAALLIGCVALTNPINAKQKNKQLKTSLENIEIENNKDIIEKLFVDEPTSYNNLNSFIDAVQFNFMVPNYIPKNYKINSLSFTPQDNIATINFNNTEEFEDHSHFSIKITQKHPVEYINEKETTSKLSSHTIDDIKGEILITNNTRLIKYFIYKKDNVYYTISYYKENTSTIDSLRESEVAKIIKSLKNPELVNKSIYEINDGSSIFNMEDMKKAREIVGFDFKLPLDIKYTNISLVNKNIISFYFAETMLWQTNLPSCNYYGKALKNEKIEISDFHKKIYDKVEVKWENINNKRVFKETYTRKLIGNQTQPDKEVIYYWSENDLTYILPCYYYDSKIDYEDIIKSIMNAKSFDEIIK